VNFILNGNEYNKGYYLANDIYPGWATLIKSISRPLGNKRKWFLKDRSLVERMLSEHLGF
jgi:hypothetical protein